MAKEQKKEKKEANTMDLCLATSGIPKWSHGQNHTQS
jgi:hypothetical protein